MTKKTESTAIVDLKAEVAARLAAQAAVRDSMATGGAYISFKGGHMSIDGTPVPSGEVAVVPLGVAFERTYYEGEYNPDVPQTPACYTFNGQIPHPEAVSPQSPTCKGCPHDEWGSGARGKGKKCRESARLAVIAADADYDTASIYTAKVPISSIGTVKDYLAYCTANGKLIGQTIAKLKVVPDAKTIFKVTLTPVDAVDVDLELVLKRMDTAEGLVHQPYPVLDAPAQKTSSKY